MGTSTRRALGLACICSSFFVVSAIDAGCGSDSFTSDVSTDAGSDSASSTETGGGDDSAAADTGPGPWISASFDATSERGRVLQRVRGDFEPLQRVRGLPKENAASCATFGDQLSDAFKAGIVACANEIDCADFENQSALAQDPCVAAVVFDAGPTAAQVDAKNAYCGNCADASVTGADYCARYFGAPDAGSIGSIVLFSSDSVATTIAGACGSCDILTYTICSGTKLCSGVPKDQCGKGLCK